MKKNKKIALRFLAILITIILVCFCYHRVTTPNRNSIDRKLFLETSIPGSTDDWIYYNPPSNQGRQLGIWRIQTKTGKKEQIWENSFKYFLILKNEIYVQTHEEIYRMESDGSNPELIFTGISLEYDAPLCYHNGWIYFFVEKESDENSETVRRYCYARYHRQTKTIEKLTYGFRTPSAPCDSSLVVSGDYLYGIITDGTHWGIFNYEIETGRQTFCAELHTGKRPPQIDVEGEYQLYLTECGDDLVLVYLDLSKHGFNMGMYATSKGKEITEKTAWKEIRFPDMQKGSSIPPHPPYHDTMQYAIREAYNCGYVFHYGYAWYLNEDWNLCCRSLFGKAEEVMIYEGTALAAYFNENSKPDVDIFNPYSCTLAFGKNNFYYYYYTAIDEVDAAINKDISNYTPIPLEWEDYIGTLPSR